MRPNLMPKPAPTHTGSLAASQTASAPTNPTPQPLQHRTSPSLNRTTSKLAIHLIPSPNLRSIQLLLSASIRPIHSSLLHTPRQPRRIIRTHLRLQRSPINTTLQTLNTLEPTLRLTIIRNINTFLSHNPNILQPSATLKLPRRDDAQQHQKIRNLNDYIPPHATTVGAAWQDRTVIVA